MKTLERLVHKRLSHFLEVNNKLNPIPNIDLETNTHANPKIVRNCSQMGQYPGLRQLNSRHFSRLFQSIRHCLMGIRGQMLLWIQDFLANRFQRVVINGCTSRWRKVTSGVPQGSILGPLLFLVYINDIGDNLHNSDVRLFADDCTISRRIQNKEDHTLLQHAGPN